MKKLILLSTVVAAGVVLAGDVETSNSYGVLPVTTSQKATMVAVPFVGDGDNISIAQMVKAQGLSVGDMIYALPTTGGSSYSAWVLNAVKSAWVSAVSADVGSGVSITAPASETATIARGQAFWLVRGSATETTFYVMGIGDTTAAADTTITGSENGTWNLVGQSSATGTKTLDDIASVVGTKGSVRLNNGDRYLYTGSAWKRLAKDAPNNPVDVDSNTRLPVGEGFWIVSKRSGSVAL